ncbi:MAG: hypothetical protein IPM54_09585 [Polyangiaceae bacterium]|nr:hypothetical protein [Polyangiaceae bacterium]
MQQPNPWILFMGGLMLFQVAAMVYGIKAAPEWAKLLGALIVAACGVLSMLIGLKRQFGKKPEPPKKVQLKRERNATRSSSDLN